MFRIPKIGILKGNCHSTVSPFALTNRLNTITNGIKKTISFMTLDHSINIFETIAIKNDDKNRINSMRGCSKITEIRRIDRSHVIFKNGEAS